MNDVHSSMQFTTLIESQKFIKERDQIKKDRYMIMNVKHG